MSELGIRLLAVAFILIACVAEAFGHIAFKRAADHGQHAEGVLETLRSGLKQYKQIAGGLALFVVEGVCTTAAMICLPVSIAYPIGGLELIVLLLLSRTVLREKVGVRRWLGVVLVIAGTALVVGS